MIKINKDSRNSIIEACRDYARINAACYYLADCPCSGETYKSVSDDRRRMRRTFREAGLYVMAFMALDNIRVVVTDENGDSSEFEFGYLTF